LNLNTRAPYRYLIIGGAPKSGTTSLFRYLSEHPDICPANRKETYFFAREFDIDKVCKCGDTLADFETFFSHCCSSIKCRLEATPYTLYAENAATRIAALLPNSSVLFILRDPVRRLISDYRFHLLRDHPSTRGTLKFFFEWQFSMRGKIPSLLKMGCYVHNIRPFLDVLGRNRVHILFFENFYAKPAIEIQKLCEKLGIDKSFYRNYDFKIHNPTINYRFSWLNKKFRDMEPLVANLRARIIHNQRFYKLFEKIMEMGKYTYRKLNNRKIRREDVFPPEVLEYLGNYYRPHNNALSDELGCPLPWNSGIEY
jgi:hypothetical protein